MANILQLNSRKGLVQLSNDDLAELNLLKWIRTSFRGIGKSELIEHTPFESVAAELYVQKYPDCQVDLATKCIYCPKEGVTVHLKTFSTPDARYHNTADNDVVIVKHESKQAKFIHRDRKKKFNSIKSNKKLAILSMTNAGGQVQKLEPTSSEDGMLSFIVGNTKDLVNINKDKSGNPIINGWPDVKGVDIYPGDVVLLISDFSGFVGNSNLRSPEMPSYDQLIQNPEGRFYSKFPQSRSYLNDFDKTMVLLDLTARRKKDIDFTRISIDDNTWATKYKPLINEKLYGQFDFNDYKSFAEFLNQINLSSLTSTLHNSDNLNLENLAQTYDKESLFSEVLGEIDLKDTYINHIPSVLAYKNSRKSKKLEGAEDSNIMQMALSSITTPTYLKDSLDNLFTEGVEKINIQDLLIDLQNKFADSNLKENYDSITYKLQEVTLSKELTYILSYLSKETREIEETNNAAISKNSDYTQLLQANLNNISTEDYKSFILQDYPYLGANNIAVDKYNSIINYLIDNGVINSVEDLSDIRNTFQSNLNKQTSISGVNEMLQTVDRSQTQSIEGLSSIQAIIDLIVNFDSIKNKDVSLLEDTELGTSDVSLLNFQDTPFKFINNYIESFYNINKGEEARDYIKFSELPKNMKEDALESIGYGKSPLTINEFTTAYGEQRDYENLWITNWTNAPAEEKAKRLNIAFGLDQEVNPDFSTALFGDEQTGLRGQNKGQSKALLDFHKYKLEQDGADTPLNLTTKDKDNPEAYKAARDEFNNWMKEYKKNSNALLNKLNREKESINQQLAGISKDDKNYNNYKVQLEDIDEKIKQISESSLASWEDYLAEFGSNDDTSSGTVEGRQSNEKRQLVKVIGFATYDDITQPNNYVRVEEYVKDYLSDVHNLKSGKDLQTLDSLVQSEIGHLLLSNVKNYLINQIKSNDLGENSHISNVEGVPLTYDAFRSTILGLYNKLGIENFNLMTPEKLKSIAKQGKDNKLITSHESTHLNNIADASYKYVQQIESEYQKELDSVISELSMYDEASLDQDSTSAIDSLLQQKEYLESEMDNLENIYSYIFTNIPDEIISQYGLLQVDPNLSKSDVSGEQIVTNIDQGRGPSRVASSLQNPMSAIDSDYSTYLMSPSVVDYISQRLSTLTSGKAVNDLVEQLAPEVQKEFINQYVENNPEIFGKGFIEDEGFDATADNADIWAVVSALNPQFNASSNNEGLYLVTPEQLLKIDGDKIDTFYSNEIKNINKGGKDFTSDTFTPYFKSEKDKQNFNTQSYQKAITEYEEQSNEDMNNKYKDNTPLNTELGATEEKNDVDKFKKGPIDNYKTQLTNYRSQLQNLPSIEKDISRLEEVTTQLNSATLTEEDRNKLLAEQGRLSKYVEPIQKAKNSYEKKIKETEKKIKEFKPQYSAEDTVKDKSRRLDADVKDLNNLIMSYNSLSKENNEADKEKLTRMKEIISKRKESINLQRDAIKELKQNGLAPEELPNQKAPQTISPEEQLIMDQEKQENRRRLQPSKYNNWHSNTRRANRKIYWLKNSLDIIEADLLSTYVKFAGVEFDKLVNEAVLTNKLVSDIDSLLEKGNIEEEETSTNSQNFSLLEDALTYAEKVSKSNEVYNMLGRSEDSTKDKGLIIDFKLSRIDNLINKFSSYLLREQFALATFNGDGSKYTSGMQSTEEMLDGNIDDVPTSNDTSTITDKRIS